MNSLSMNSNHVQLPQLNTQGGNSNDLTRSAALSTTASEQLGLSPTHTPSLSGANPVKALLQNLGVPQPKFISPAVVDDGTSAPQPAKIDVLAILKQLSQRKLSEQQILTNIMGNNTERKVTI